MTEYELEQMMNQYGDYIARTCYIYLKDWALAEDAVQEVFIKAYRYISEFRKESSEKTWLTSIAINICKNYVRTSWFRKVQIGIEKIETRNTLEDELINQINQSELLKQVMDLPIKYREVILLYYYQDFKINEIAEILGISESSIKMRLNRARKKLKDDFEEECIYG
ncbi:sigma-70 family RNA polymerase sigma factor [Cellulosilyticum sp. ST5]|uniref:RNA polymerase, sigma-24 subunit, ECF subfamily n=1 Tax=Cellulosilyticum lentocellum (strain ATCC 49066 / DSM 5427 / NCIMB 11756 / RHM5) TaxID=642492 RepID=F2JL92_CELLD|nr:MULTISPECIES: sigma-70 family RNA polymerase sigma factor [Cellulosilyticum]ADZ85737.1 RNA polymerase, sigma-24 subunit, ECF subfamily [Cellulosilyticum lentocellum DSM 5427]QEH67194.1 sigma-70 family RNA polymerase sigma factor [Cellulosilyticum sp. WCF-2]